MDFYDSLSRYERRKTESVRIGSLLMGSNYPVRVQSMTTTDTSNTEASVEQCKRIFDAGADLVRLTAQGIREAENLEQIRRSLVASGYDKPLVADIHFNPNAAEVAARHVQKVRINPGNFIDKRASFVDVTLSDEEYAEELQRLRVKFINLLNICKENSTAIRIGVNHGSLSDRIMSRYGDTPEGMVESAMEFLRICIDQQFKNVVLSMKSSNVRVMVHAYRLLTKRMKEEEMYFPLHLGVTEAGEGEDGRIKSAVGIGTLLADGIGDTIRVSLTEEPEAEIPVANALVAHFSKLTNHQPIAPTNASLYSPYEYVKMPSFCINGVGGDCAPVVVGDLSHIDVISANTIAEVGYQLSADGLTWSKATDTAPDILLVGSAKLQLQQTNGLMLVGNEQGNLASFGNTEIISASSSFVWIDAATDSVALASWLKQNGQTIVLLCSNNSNPVAELRSAILNLRSQNVGNPIIVCQSYNESNLSLLQLCAAADCGALFVDGLAEGILITNKGTASPTDTTSIAFGILQAARVRISKTEFISCPGCGRTLFDLQQTAAKIRERTKHLTGLKIGIMGCIVNGPGEMADADYGYVGAGPKKVTLYKGKLAVKKNIPQEEALDELINLIKENGDWKDA